MVHFKISLIAAIGKNKELGKDNKLLVKIPEDMLFFKNTTLGHPVIMGRKTYLSIGKPLDNRTNIVISKSKNFRPAGVLIAHSLEEAISLGENHDRNEVFIIGGGSVFQQAIKLADKLYLTVIDKSFAADVYFPDYSEFKKVLYKRQGSWKDLKFTIFELSKL